MDSDQLNALVGRYLNQTATQEEIDQLMILMADPANEAQLKQILGEKWNNWESVQMLSGEHSQKIFNAIDARIETVPARTISMRFGKWIAAASLIAAIAGVYYFNRPAAEKKIAVTQKVEIHDIKAPDNSRAVIILGNGQRIFLDSAGAGTLAVQNNVQVSKSQDGQIIYSGKSETASFNTLTNPRGSKVVNITLADGSRVWLNSQSSITFPTAFTGSQRKVNISGEAYFEVAKNASMPFVVSAGETQVTVLGTHFNVNAYPDEPTLQTTLAEGSVKVSHGDAKIMLVPGQQARVTSTGQLNVIKDADVDLALAWKNGFTVFKSTDIKTIMRQVQRWYGVDVTYEGNIPERFFTGGISRNANLSELLRLLEISEIHFKLEGTRLTVLP